MRGGVNVFQQVVKEGAILWTPHMVQALGLTLDARFYTGQRAAGSFTMFVSVVVRVISN